MARAIAAKTHPFDPYDEISEEGRDKHREVARAAIAAMREPTDAMIEAAERENIVIGDHPHHVCHTYEIMIDAALSEAP